MVDFTSDLEAQLLVTKRLQAGRDWEVEQLRESKASLTSQLEEKDQQLASLQHQLSKMNKVCSAHYAYSVMFKHHSDYRECP